MDPTSNAKLTAISNEFRAAGGRVYLGDEVWGHLEEMSGVEIATFVQKYVKEPVANIAVRERQLLDLGLRYRTGPAGDMIEITIGEHQWTIPRQVGTTAALDEDDGEDEE